MNERYLEYGILAAVGGVLLWAFLGKRLPSGPTSADAVGEVPGVMVQPGTTPPYYLSYNAPGWLSGSASGTDPATLSGAGTGGTEPAGSSSPWTLPDLSVPALTMPNITIPGITIPPAGGVSLNVGGGGCGCGCSNDQTSTIADPSQLAAQLSPAQLAAWQAQLSPALSM